MTLRVTAARSEDDHFGVIGTGSTGSWVVTNVGYLRKEGRNATRNETKSGLARGKEEISRSAIRGRSRSDQMLVATAWEADLSKSWSSGRNSQKSYHRSHGHQPANGYRVGDTFGILTPVDILQLTQKHH